MRPAGALGTLLAILLVVVPGVAGLGHLASSSGLASWSSPNLLLSLFVLAVLLVPFALLSLDPVVDHLRRMVDGRPITSCVLAASLLCPYSLYWGGPGKASLAALFRLVLYVGAASLLAVRLPRHRARTLGDLAVVLAVWLPVELRWLDASFPWPPKGSGRILCGLLALDLLLYLLLVVRRTEGIGYSFRLRPGDLRPVFGAFLAYALVGIPLGIATGFLSHPIGWPPPGRAAESLVLIFLFTGMPEETLFRGFLQGILTRATGRPVLALAAVALLFGLAHLDNGPHPDWRYFVLATLAGLAYGWVYMARGRVVAPALTHTLVDTTWKLFFSR